VNKISSPGAGNTFLYLILEYFLRFFTGFFISAWMARSLGTEKFGLFSYVISFVMIFTPFFTMGMEEIPTKDLVLEKNKKNEILGTSFYIRIIGGVVGNISCLLSVGILHSDDMFLALIIMAYSLSMLFKSLQVIENYFLSIQDIKRISIGRNCVFTLVTLLKAIFLYLGYKWEFFVYIAMVEVILFGIIYICSYKKTSSSIFSWKVSGSRRRIYLKSSFVVFLTTLITVANSRVDQIMIKNIDGNSSLGEYAAAVKLVEIWQFAPLAIISAMFPSVVRAKAKSFQDYLWSLKKLNAIILGLSIFLCVGASTFSQIIIDLVYGSEYSNSVNILIGYSLTIILSYFSIARARVFVIEDCLKDAFSVMLFVFILNIFLNYFLILREGALGAVLATILSYVFGNSLYCIFNKKIRQNMILYFSSVKHIPSVIRNFLKST
jgi:PST family polysaccharide transporter